MSKKEEWVLVYRGYNHRLESYKVFATENDLRIFIDQSSNDILVGDLNIISVRHVVTTFIDTNTFFNN